MGERNEYAAGTFSWADLSTTDQEEAKSFYRELFGWTAVDNPVGDDVVYSIMQLDGKDVAAIGPQPEQQRDAGVPPTWNSYVTVESADAMLTKTEQLGGSAHTPAFDVLDVGRMAVLQDPQGAFFMVWQPKRRIGATVVNAPGALSWNELATPDIDGSTAFYGELFGWEIQPFEGSDQPYFTIQNNGHGNGGIRPLMPGEPQAYWLVYFGTEDVEQGVARVEQLGGSKLADPVDIGVGKLGFAADPQGAVFALYAGRFEP